MAKTSGPRPRPRTRHGTRLPWSSENGPALPGATETPACPLRQGSPDDPRIGDIAGRALARGEWPLAAIIGFRSDEGVRRNGGRTGAAEAPDRIRSWFYRLTPGVDSRLAALCGRLHDFGNIPVDSDLETAQARLGEAVSACLEHGTILVVLGGGHETTFGHFLGYAATHREVAIVNWDAHADVRPLLDGRGHSGSPFRQILEHKSRRCRSYTVAGLQRHAVAAAHLEYLRARECRVVWRDEVTAQTCGPIYAQVPRGRELLVSFDLDAVDQASAPGVSAPATGGLPAELWLDAARQAGATPAVRSIDIVENSPPLDRDDQTSRLAALTVWQFLNGLASRDH